MNTTVTVCLLVFEVVLPWLAVLTKQSSLIALLSASAHASLRVTKLAGSGLESSFPNTQAVPYVECRMSGQSHELDDLPLGSRRLAFDSADPRFYKDGSIPRFDCFRGFACSQVMEIWATHYGAEAGVMGLRCIPTGGLFIAGGMTHKNLRMLEVRVL